jgi:hypothetical protein
MATLAQKIEAETKMRELLEDSGLPQPDHVEYGFTCIRLFFEKTKTVVVIDIDEPDQFEDDDADLETDVADGPRTDVADAERSRRGRRLG